MKTVEIFLLLSVVAVFHGADSQKSKLTVLVHGGAGEIAEENIASRKYGVKIAARIGYETLRSTGSVLDAVEAAVSYMESDAQFNSGYGSVLTWEGKVEMDAAIMNGADLDAGCVSIVRDIEHPIQLARRVMEKSQHVYLAGEGLKDFAVEEGITLLDEGALVTEKSLKALEAYKQSLENNEIEVTPELFGSTGTVGAVAIDEDGNVAAATSTGGLTGKKPGRIGDSPILGAGTYADNAFAAISATGNGETILRYNVASKILALIEFQGFTALEATSKVLEDMTNRFNQTAGVISIDASGNLGIHFTSKHMSWAYQRDDELHYGVIKNEDTVEIVGKPRVPGWSYFPNEA